MYYKTKNMAGEAIQYKGDNLNELKETYPDFEFKKLESKTYWQKNYYNDLRILSRTGDADLLAGDWIFGDSQDWRVIPMLEFYEYWEQV